VRSFAGLLVSLGLSVAFSSASNTNLGKEMERKAFSQKVYVSRIII